MSCLVMSGVVILLSLICGAVVEAKWDAVKVKWNLDTAFYDHFPLTDEFIQSHGFVKMTDCGELPFHGRRFWRKNDLSLILIYDKQGTIAGIQSGINSTQWNALDQTQLGGYPMVAYDGVHYITVYFIQPNQICSTGRTKDDLNDGVGENLYLVTPSTQTGLTVVHGTQSLDVTAWDRGTCIPLIGTHFWKKDGAGCEGFFPFFSIVRLGDTTITEFGWVLPGNVAPANRGQRFDEYWLSEFYAQIPECDGGAGKRTVMHVSLTKINGAGCTH